MSDLVEYSPPAIELAAEDELRAAAPHDPTREGCPVRTKRRNVTVEKGVPATVDWHLRDAEGRDRDLSSILPPPADSLSTSVPGYACVKVRFALADVVAQQVQEVAGESISPSSGHVRFALPESIYNRAGVHLMSVGVIGTDGKPVVTDSGLVFVEPGLWGDVSLQGTVGPPSFKEIRGYIRDTRAENDFLRDVEFDDDEIVQAIIAPVREANEMLPIVTQWTCQNFPYRELWIKGALGHLYRVAAAWYLRQKIQTSHGGITVDDRNKNAEYDKKSEMYLAEFRTSIRALKVRLNIQRGFGTLSSTYSRNW